MEGAGLGGELGTGDIDIRVVIGEEGVEIEVAYALPSKGGLR
jgi:hypothetical protein